MGASGTGETVVILQARTGSKRLPGKVLADVGGRPLLALVIERSQAIQGVDRVLVATTTAEGDRPILSLARDCGAEAFTGSEEDVLDRFYRVARAAGASTIVRVTADCPLLDPSVSSLVVARFLQGSYDYVSNTHPPTFPDGLDTEVFSFNALERAWSEARLPSEREHVTPYLWKQPDRFRIGHVEGERDLSGYRWTVDESADLAFVRAVYGRLNRQPRFGMQQVLALLNEHPELQGLNEGAVRDAGYARSVSLDPIEERRVR